MDRHAARRADRLQAPIHRQVALVERVPGLVQNAHQRLGEIVLVVAGGDAHVVGGAAAKRMGADIEPAMREIEADPLHQARRRPALRRDRERASAARASAATPLGGPAPPRSDRAGNRRSRRTGDRSRRPKLRARSGREEPRTGSRPRRSALAAATSRCSRSISSRNGSTAAKSFAGRAVRHTVSHCEEMRERASTNAPGSASAWPRRRVISRRLALCHGSSACALALRLGQQIADLGGGQLLVGEQAQARQLLGAGGGTPRRHHRGTIPIEHADRFLDRAEAAKSRFQLLIGGHRGSALRR